MAIRLSGLNSGMDTDSIVQALMSAQRYKQTKIKAKQTKLEWKQEIWSGLNTKLYNFYKDTLAKIKMQGTFKTKAANSSDSSKVTATATSSAAEGTYKVKVNSLASAQYVTSDSLKGAYDKDGNIVAVNSKTKLVDLVNKDGSRTFESGTQISINTTKGLTTILVDENTTVSDFVTACQNGGLTASFDTTQQRFFISSATSGEDQGFTITAAKLSQSQKDAISGWKDAIGYDYLSSSDKTAVSKLFDKFQAGTVNYDDVSATLQKYVEKSQATAVNAYYTKQRTDYYTNLYFVNGDPTQGVNQTAANQALLDSGMTQDKIDALTPDDKVKALQSLVTKNTKADLATDEYKGKIADGIANGISDSSASAFLQQSATDRLDTLKTSVSNFVSEASGIDDSDADNILSGLGLAKVTGDAVAENSDGTGMVVVAASDASITFNGATLKSSTSTLTVNGLTLEIMGMTEGEEVTISVTKDTSAVYDTIKDFISGYNSILKEMNSLYNASSAKGYEVLTDEQKEAMTDDEIEKWEDKIKASLLRRDDTLNSLISSFRLNMMGSYTASNGKSYSLASLGIKTSTDYTEGGLLHIAGDEDDSTYADSANILESLLKTDPDTVMEVINGLADNLYTDLQKKMSTSRLSSALTFYNDKEMASQLSDYKKQIAKWEEKLLAMENRYYSQFTAMEKAMAKLNSQQNYFSSMFG